MTNESRNPDGQAEAERGVQFDAIVAEAVTDSIDRILAECETPAERGAIGYFYDHNGYARAPESPLYADLDPDMLHQAMFCRRFDAERDLKRWRALTAIRASHPRLGRALTLTAVQERAWGVGYARNMNGE